MTNSTTTPSNINSGRDILLHRVYKPSYVIYGKRVVRSPNGSAQRGFDPGQVPVGIRSRSRTVDLEQIRHL